MSDFNPDIIVRLVSNFDQKGNFESGVIKTNAKPETLESIIEPWLSTQLGTGRDDREPNQRKSYTVEIQLDLTTDTFQTISDTGNKGLTLGLVRFAFSFPTKFPIEPLN